MKKLFLTAIILGLMSPFAIAADADAERVKKMVAKQMPRMKIDSVNKTVIPGIYEVVSGVKVSYATEDGRYIIQGDLVDLKTKQNISENIRLESRKKVINSIDESTMIVFTPEKVKHTITVLTDIDCGYCRKLHRDMEGYLANGIKVRYLAYPRAGVDSHSYEKAVSVWCAEDKQNAMTIAKSGKEPEPKKCDNPVKDHMAAGRSLGVTGTPTLILESGRVIPGYRNPERLIVDLKKES
jgi:thiol:disulfide interchange protein DsbC